MSQKITDILREWTGCDGEALNRLMPVVFGELRSLARQQLARQQLARPGKDHTLQPTALVHEAYMRLRSCRVEGIEDRDQFFALASCLMRRILVDHARQRLAAKRGGGASTVALDEAPNALRQEPVALETVLSVHQALGKLERLHPRQGRVVALRYFGGMTLPETAKALKLSLATVERDWSVARRWLAREITREVRPRSPGRSAGQAQ